MRVMMPRNFSPSVTIATMPPRNITMSCESGASTGTVTRWRLHRLGHRLVEVLRIREHFHEDVFLIDDANDAPVIQHRNLRDIVELHAAIGGKHGFCRSSP